MKTVCLFVCSLWLLAARAQPTSAPLAGTWIGVHSEWDTDVFCPLPTYLQFDADGQYRLGLVDGSATPIRSTWAVQNDTVRLDTVHYAPGLITVQNGLLRIGKFYPMTFRLFTDVPLDSALVQQQLAGRVWQSDSSTVALFADGRVTIENRTTKQRTAHFWRLARFGSSVFLVIRGNQYDRNRDYTPLWQLTEITPMAFRAVGWNSRAVATETFRQVRTIRASESAQPGGFQTCSNCFTPAFFAMNPGRSARRYDLLQLVAQHYQPVVLPGQSGLLRISFVVNCQGESGRYELTGLDTDYCPKTFDVRITGQLLAFCRNYVATDATLRESDQPDNRPNDIAVLLTFRLTDGRITDLLP